MKSDKNILIAFILNLSFSIFEFVGGIFTGSVAIASDAVHDIGDATSIGVSYFLERISKKQPDGKYNHGYARFSVLGGFITTLILFVGSALVIYKAVERLFNPQPINYDGMIVFAVIGVAVNLGAAFFTRHGDSINQKAVNLHMLEDVLGWIVVLVGAVVMRFWDLYFLDSLLSIGVAAFILINACRSLKEIADIFLEKTPDGFDLEKIREHILEIEGVKDVHHIHIRSIDGHSVHATMHIVTNGTPSEIKDAVKRELAEHGICHSTLELESEDENCCDKHCHTHACHSHTHVHAHHHHGHNH